jgi:hypothetical protein
MDPSKAVRTLTCEVSVGDWVLLQGKRDNYPYETVYAVSQLITDSEGELYAEHTGEVGFYNIDSISLIKDGNLIKG